MKVLLTGATGYIGRRLKVKLLEERGVKLRLFVRNIKKVREESRRKVEIVEGDTFSMESLRGALRGIDVAYYLVHSMGAKGDFRKLDRISAKNFREACVAEGVKRIIYLGGLGKKKGSSEHLMSRIETGEILSARPEKIQTLWFRAAMIIGSGSASFEILWNFVEKVPLMIVPRSIKTLTQPIAIEDVLEYLARAKDLRLKGDLVVDIGAQKMTYEEMLRETAGIIGLRRFIIPVPILRPRLSSYLYTVFFPVPRRISSYLLRGLLSETVIVNDNAAKYFPEIKPAGFPEAMRRAIAEMENNQVLSRWSDSGADRTCDIKEQGDISPDVLKDRRVSGFGSVPPRGVFLSVMGLGGDNGWFTYHFLWEIRGLIDKLLGGYGINRGRRDARKLRIGDSLDFWKVCDIVEDRRVLLVAQMKLPGKAWLEFLIEKDTLVQTAYFLPHGLRGRLYWYLLLPTHYFIFRDMAKNIIKNAERMHTPPAGRGGREGGVARPGRKSG